MTTQGVIHNNQHFHETAHCAHGSLIEILYSAVFIFVKVQLSWDIKTLIKNKFHLFFYELLMSLWSSSKRPPSIILLYGHLRELFVVSDQLWLWPLLRISGVVAYERFDCTTVKFPKSQLWRYNRNFVRPTYDTRFSESSDPPIV